MTEQELLMDSLERDITKVIQDNRHRMYQRMSAEKFVPKSTNDLKYRLRYEVDNIYKDKVLKPQLNTTLITQAEFFLNKNVGFCKDITFWIYDGKHNLIYNQIVK